MNAADPTFLPAHVLAAKIRSRQLSPVALTERLLDRIAAAQPVLNAFITICRDEALAAARTAEAALDRGDALGPLHGIPVSVKDIINTAGIRTTWGSRLMAENVPASDAVAVARLKQAGAILLGKTTTSEFAHKLLTDAPLFGATRNPWDLERTPGGSSGGSAVAVAAGLGPLSLATDAGASTRLPAACTGIVGLKPTLGLVPHSQVPDGFNNFIHLGLMARDIRDVALMLDVLAGPEASDPHSIAVPRPGALAALDAGVTIAGRRIAWRPLLGNRLLDDEVRAAGARAVALLRRLGASVDEIDEPYENAEPAWRILQQANWAARFGKTIDQVAPRLDPSFVDGIRAGMTYTGQDLLQATYKRTQHFRAVQGWFARYDLVLTPTASRPPLALTHGALEPITVNGEDAGDMRQSWAPYLNLFDLTGHPAISVPAGFTKDGLPIGLQLIGRWYEDAALLQAAAGFEAAAPWADRRPPHAAP